MNDIEICNIALGFIPGCKSIASLDENSREARACKEYFSLARGSMLEGHRWGFVEKRANLALLSFDPSTSSKFTFAYQFPADCLFASKIYNPGSETDLIDWKQQINATKDDIMILTDQEDAQLIYTTTTESFTVMKAHLFQEALAYKLASLMAIKLSQSEKTADRLINMYQGHAFVASGNDSNSEHDQPEANDDYITARQ